MQPIVIQTSEVKMVTKLPIVRSTMWEDQKMFGRLLALGSQRSSQRHWNENRLSYMDRQRKTTVSPFKRAVATGLLSTELCYGVWAAIWKCNSWERYAQLLKVIREVQECPHGDTTVCAFKLGKPSYRHVVDLHIVAVPYLFRLIKLVLGRLQHLLLGAQCTLTFFQLPSRCFLFHCCLCMGEI